MRTMLRWAGAVTLGLTIGWGDALALELDASGLVAGEEATFTATGATPGAEVVFVAGTTVVTDCPVAGAEECLRPGVQLGVARADAEGVAVLHKPLHGRTPAGEFVFQALERGATPAASGVLRASVRARDALIASAR